MAEKKKAIFLQREEAHDMLIKLLATRIVANSFLGLSNKFTTSCWVLLRLPSSVITSAGVSEKKATSEPDTSELAMTNSIKATAFTIRYDGLISESCASKVKLGSGSSVGKSKF